jgi:acetyltransferase-like isoleucine patch superfamily enzyme
VEEGAFVCEHAWLICPSESATVRVGAGTSIRPYAQLLADTGFVHIGRDCTVNSFCILNGAGGLTIGDHVRIGAQTTIIAGNHGFDDDSRSIREQEAEGTRKGIVIADDVWMGYGVRITDGVKVGAHSVLAAGTVITHDVPENAIICGVPGRVLRMRGESRP